MREEYTFKKCVAMLADLADYSDDNMAWWFNHVVDRCGYQAGKITWADYETLFAIYKKITERGAD